MSEDALFYRELVSRAKNAKYGDARFWVINYTINSGRKVKEESFSGAAGVASTSVGGAVKIRRMYAAMVSNPAINEEKREAYYEKHKKILSTSVVDANAEKIPIGANYVPIDLAANVYKINMRVFFLNTNEKGRFIPYTEHRDAFIKQMQDPNPKMLQLPTYKKFPAIPASCKATYDSKKNGYEMADVVFYRATANVVVEDVDISVASVFSKIDALDKALDTLGEAQTSLLAKMTNASGNLASTTAQATQATQKKSLLKSIQGLNATISAKIAGTMGTVSNVLSKATAISENIASLVMQPVDLMRDLSGLYDTMISVVTSPIEAMNYFVVKAKTFTLDLKESTERIPNAVTTLAVNLGLYSSSVHVAHAVLSFNAVATSALSIDFTSSQEAIEARDSISDIYNDLISVVSEHTEYASFLPYLNAVYSGITSYLITLQAILPQIRNIEVPSDTPLITIAYNVYGDANMESDLLNRNGLKSMYYLPNTLEVVLPNEN